jgi:alpha-tubulin suppressor-like RCC1 family protein
VTRTLTDLAWLRLLAGTGFAICASACTRTSTRTAPHIPVARGSAGSTPVPSSSGEPPVSAFATPFTAAPALPIREVVLNTRTTCALAESGVAYCWGDNEHSSAVPGAPSIVPRPLRVALPEPVRQIATGMGHSCALTESGAVYCWGTIHFRPTVPAATITARPERVPGLPAAQSIAVGDTHACAVLGDARIACWGNNRSGQLGLGTTRVLHPAERPLLAKPTNPPAHRPNPTLVPGVESAIAVAAGGSATCALLTGGSLACWGQGFACEAPVLLPELGTNNRALGAGHGAFCWLTESAAPYVAPPLDTRSERDPTCHPYDHDPRATQLAINSARAVACTDHINCPDCLTCAIAPQGTLDCWQPKDARPGPIDQVLDVARDVRNAASVAIERSTICVITKEKRLLCWGSNLRGELGRGSSAEFEMTPDEPSWPE